MLMKIRNEESSHEFLDDIIRSNDEKYFGHEAKKYK